EVGDHCWAVVKVPGQDNDAQHGCDHGRTAEVELSGHQVGEHVYRCHEVRQQVDRDRQYRQCYTRGREQCGVRDLLHDVLWVFDYLSVDLELCTGHDCHNPCEEQHVQQDPEKVSASDARL